MKNFSFLVLFLLTNMVRGQKIERFYDHNWNISKASAARFYSILIKTDSGWQANDYYLATNRLQMTGLYIDSSGKIKNGYFTYYHPNGYLQSLGKYKRNKKDGQWISLYENGYMRDSAFFEDGDPVGNALGWSRDGTLIDSLHVSEDGKAVHVGWFPNGNISSTGRFDESKSRVGRWQFYYKEGGVSSSEIYENDMLKQFTYFTKDGKPIDNPDTTAKPAEFPGGLGAWQKHLAKKIYFPNYRLKNTTKVSVAVEFTIDEEGFVKDAEVVVPIHPEFDRIALEAIKKSPKWIPAKSHNRNVRYVNRQVVSFGEVE